MIIEELAAKLGLDLDQAAFARGVEAIEGLRVGLGAVAGIAAAVGGVLVGVTKSVAENAIELSKSAQRAGVAVDSYQELAFAAEQSGTSLEDLQHSMILLSRQAFEAAHGSHEAAFAFRQVGVGVYDAAGKIKPTDELLEDLADRFSQMPDGIKKTALATQTFGRGGAQLLPFLNKGRAGIDELREAAHEYGVVLDEDVIAAAKRWQEQQKHLFASLKGLRNAIGGEFLKRLGTVTEKIADWIKRNRELITGQLFYWLDNLKQLLVPIAKIVEALLIDTDAWKYSLVALAAILAVINFPLLLIVGALLAIEDAYKFFEGKPSVLGHLLGDEETQNKVRDFMTDVRDFFKYVTSGQLGEDLAATLERWGEEIDKWLAQHPLIATIATRAAAIALNPISGTVAAYSSDVGNMADAAKRFGAPALGALGALGIPGVPSVPFSGGTQVVRERTTVPVTINAAAGMDEKELANRTADAVDARLQREHREAFAAVDQ